ncbi:MAG: LysR family transcriptional regulator [Rhodocyclaceae bacterium]|nr:LysR family transcriptional regulator [Rhodocyclaceae bacterium]
MDKLKLMEAFVAIADEGSLTAAAQRQGSSLPAMVRALARLETHLGIRLINRTTRRIALTEEGRQYLARCRQVLADIDEAEAALTDRGPPSGTVTITAPVMFGRLHVAPLVAHFLAAEPAIRVNLLLLDRVVDLLEEGIDLALRIGRLQDSSMVALPLGHIRWLACASPDFLARHGTPVEPDALRALPCVRMLGNPALAGWRFSTPAGDAVIDVRGALATNQLDVAVDACRRGLGVGRFLSYQVAEALQRGELVEVLPAFAPPPSPVHFVYPHSRLLSSRVRAFIQACREPLQRDLAGLP